MNRRRIMLLAAAAVLILTACGTGAPGDRPTTPEDPPGAGSPSPTAPASLPQDVWAAVLADLEGRRGGPPEDLDVVTAEAVTWNDGSLGCPQPGMAYTQALVDGYHVVLDVGGERYDYRVGSGTAVRLCTSPPTR